MKVMTVVGTRPEIIRLSRVIARLDESFEHVLVHTGQNWDPKLSDVFFDEMEIRRADINMGIDVSSLGSSIAGVMRGTEKVIQENRPDAFLVLGDTNSALSLIIAKRLRIPTYHMEAGNRCFDDLVPEETNRRIIDHAADFNMAYTEHARRNLLLEGLHPSRTSLTGSPLREVFDYYQPRIDQSPILDQLSLDPERFFVVSAHREETVDSEVRLRKLVDCMNSVAANWELPLIVSVHPRTRQRLSSLGPKTIHPLVSLMDPLGFFDYNSLQTNAFCVLSDSGSISEESAIAGFPAVTLRASIERPEALDSGSIILSDVESQQVSQAIDLVVNSSFSDSIPNEYCIADTSKRVCGFVQSTAPFLRR